MSPKSAGGRLMNFPSKGKKTQFKNEKSKMAASVPIRTDLTSNRLKLKPMEAKFSFECFKNSQIKIKTGIL